LAIERDRACRGDFATQKLEQLKSMLNEGVITQAQYNKASQEVLNEVVK
jgi:hypothetical protein